MNVFKDYFSRQFDFCGEEDAKDYRRKCLLLLLIQILISCMIQAAKSLAVILPDALVLCGVSVLVLVLYLPAFAATLRRCEYLGRSKAWVILITVFPGPLILRSVLGKDREM